MLTINEDEDEKADRKVSLLKVLKNIDQSFFFDILLKSCARTKDTKI
jgi:hypothetical protein